MNANAYVEEREGVWRVAGSRVSVDSVVYAFRDGLSPEAIVRECYPSLALEQVYGVITFYLGNRATFDAQLLAMEARSDAARSAQRGSDLSFCEKMAQARQVLLAAR